MSDTTPSTNTLSANMAGADSGHEKFPAPALCLRVGVTANRWRKDDEPDGFRISPKNRATLQQTISNVLTHISNAVQRVYDSDAEAEYYARIPPVINLISPLAEGGDRLVATVARSLENPWPVDVIVPCDIAARPDRDPHIPLKPLWNAARSRLILDGDQDDDASLIETNRRMMWNCDVLVAIWDNQLGRGEAGTARVVEIAAELGLPVIQIDAEPDKKNPALHAYRVIEPAGNTIQSHGADTDIDTLIARVLGPPEGMEHDVHEALRSTAEYRAVTLSKTEARSSDRGQKKEIKRHRDARRRVLKLLAAFRSEYINSAFVRRASGFTWGVAMFALTRFGKRVQKVSWKIAASVNSGYGAPWEHVMMPASSMDDALAHALTPSFRRADYFASAYATRHRGSTVWMVLLAPLAVMFAWFSQYGAPHFLRELVNINGEHARLVAAALELASLIAILYVYLRAQVKGFHARWLDYRLLAERLRHLGFLWPLSRASLVIRVPLQNTPEDPHTAWVNWWYRATARQLPVPGATFTPEYLQWYLEFLREQVVKDQQHYLDGTYHTAEVAEGRVRAIAWVLFSIAFVMAALHVAFSVVHFDAPVSLEELIKFVAIVFPGFGAAAHAFGSNLGLPEQALRSASTLRALGVVREGLRDVDVTKPLASIVLGDLAQQTASALGDDLFGWRVDYLVRPTPQPG